MLLLQLGSCLPCLFTWSLTLIIIDGNEDTMFLYPAETERKWEGGKRGSERVKEKQRAHRKETASHLYSLHVSDVFDAYRH